MIKNYTGKKASFAKGGAVLGRTSEFLKTPDRFRESQYKSKAEPTTEDVYGKGEGGKSVPAAKDKSLKAIKPRG